MLYPDLPPNDYAKAVEIAQAHVYGVSLVIGSSRGGAVAMGLTTDTPLLLLAPAWKMCGITPTLPNERTYIIHGLADERVPHEDSEELAGGVRDRGQPDPRHRRSFVVGLPGTDPHPCTGDG